MRLEEMDYDVNRWVKESVVRAMGVCARLRDDRLDIPEKYIREGLSKKDSSKGFYEEHLENSLLKLKTYQERTDLHWKAEYLIEREAERLVFNQNVAQWKRKKTKYRTSLQQIDALLKKAKKEKQSELIVNTLEFAKQQLTSTIDFDYDSPPFRPKILNIKSSKKWKEISIERVKKDIDYYSEAIEKEKIRNHKFDPVNEYDRLVEFINANGKTKKA